MRLSLWCSPMLGSSRMYSTFTSLEPIWVASLILWLSPPESEDVARSRDRYSRPTSIRTDILSFSSLSMSRAMSLSLCPSLPSRESTQSFRCEISMAETSDMVLPSILKYCVSWLSLVPWHTGHTIFSVMLPVMPGKDTISEEAPSPTLKSSSEPYMIRVTASSGISSIGEYMEKLYFLAMDLIMSNFFVSRTLPSGTMPPSAIDTEVSGIMLPMFMSTIIPSPLQCGQ